MAILLLSRRAVSCTRCQAVLVQFLFVFPHGAANESYFLTSCMSYGRRVFK
jgi:hypothetical protein